METVEAKRRYVAARVEVAALLKEARIERTNPYFVALQLPLTQALMARDGFDFSRPIVVDDDV